jgi:hypothetical protein
MCNTVLAPIDPLRVAKRQILHDTRQRDLSHLDDQMEMICHKAIAMEAKSATFYAVLQERKKPTAVFSVKEYVLLGIAAHDHMIYRSRIMYSWFAWHVGILS